MRALLVVNPRATATTRRTREVIAAALAHELKLDITCTSHRGHATQLARQACLDGLDVVFALGGDGTVNEVVNGLLGEGPSAAVPALGVVPAGSTNVFARALGLADGPVDATGRLIDALRRGHRRMVGLGRADERWFTFCAGMGLDAEVVAAVERRRAAGHPSTPGLYVRTTARHFYTGADRRRPALTIERPGAAPVDGVFMGIVSNASPWTYFGRRPVNPCPDASFDRGLDVFALRRLATTTLLRHVGQALAGSAPHGRHHVALHDETELVMRADRPTHLAVDGESLGRRSQVRFTSADRALAVLV